MTLLAVDDLHLSFGNRRLFAGESLGIEPRDRVGLVGPNGSGKSTLLRILARKMAPDHGEITLGRGCRVGYLPQEHSVTAGAALLDFVLSAAPERDAIELRIAALERELAEAGEPEVQLTLSEELALRHEELGTLEQQFGAHEAKRILAGLGFSDEDLGRPVSALSGGWRMRAALAALLFERPDVLLLDEPTNHLDLPSVEWFSAFLGGFGHALILTCHDKEFLNRHATRILSLEIEGLRAFRGNYDAYVEQRRIDLEHLENRAKREEQRKKELEAFVERFRAKASKARQAQSKAKTIEKMQERRIELPRPRRQVSIRFGPVARAGDTVLRISGVHYGYDGAPLFQGLDLSVQRGDRIALVGMNGAGKTTLFRLMAGELEPERGEIALGHNVTLRYFAQHHAEALDLSRSVLEEVRSAEDSRSETEVRTLCGAFLFSDDEVEKRVGVLSGGEKARVALAKLLARPGNLLLLDEPTNHLDTESADRLTESLLTYEGTLLFVSHSLDFARRLSNQVWDVKRGRVEAYPGSIGDYLEHLALAGEGTSAPEREKKAAGKSTEKAARIEERERAKKRENEARREQSLLVREAGEAEARVSRLEAELMDLARLLADPATHADPARSRDLAKRHAAIERALEGAIAAWERAASRLEANA